MFMYRGLIVACLVPLITGCIVIPLVSDITGSDVNSIRPGQTTKAEIESKLGTPNVLDETRFAAYRLSEGKTYLGILKSEEVYVDETYDLTFSYDANGVVKEFDYARILARDSAGFRLVEDQFPGLSVEITTDDSYSDLEISNQGNWVTFITPNKLIFHEIDGQHIEIDRKDEDFGSLIGSDDCLQKLQTIRSSEPIVDTSGCHPQLP